jgi:hypothetical protein
MISRVEISCAIARLHCGSLQLQETGEQPMSPFPRFGRRELASRSRRAILKRARSRNLAIVPDGHCMTLIFLGMQNNWVEQLIPGQLFILSRKLLKINERRAAS